MGLTIWSTEMDTSKDYIEMCRQAKEIQQLRPFPSDCGYSSKKDNIYIFDGHYYEKHLDISNICVSPIVWLPNQDNLQNMVKNKKLNGIQFVYRI